MPVSAEGLARLSLCIDRLLDADLLLPEDTEPLRAEADEAAACLKDGDVESARQHCISIAGAARALVQAGLLDPASGAELLEAVGRLDDSGAA